MSHHTLPHDYYRRNMSNPADWRDFMGQHHIPIAEEAATQMEQEQFVLRMKKMLQSLVIQHFLKNAKNNGAYYGEANSLEAIKGLFERDMEGDNDNALFAIMQMGSSNGWRDSICGKVLTALHCTILEPPFGAQARTTFVKRFLSKVIAAVRRSVNEAGQRTHGRYVNDRRANREKEELHTPLKRRASIGSGKRLSLKDEVDACGKLASLQDRCITASGSPSARDDDRIRAPLAPFSALIRTELKSPLTRARRGAHPGGGSTVKTGSGRSTQCISALFAKQQGTQSLLNTVHHATIQHKGGGGAVYTV